MYNYIKPKTQNFELVTPSFEERISVLKKKNNTKKIIYIKNYFDNSTFRYRTYNLDQSLGIESNYEISYFLNSEIELILSSISLMSIIIFQRTNWSYEIETLCYLAKTKQIPVLYDIDDLIYNIDYLKEYVLSIDPNVKNLDKYKEVLFHASNYNLVMKKCEGFICTNNFLADLIKKDYDKPVWIIQNFLNLEQEEISKNLVQNKESLYCADTFKIGYFSGSHSHNNDFKHCVRGIIEFLKKYKNTHLKIVGFIDLPPEFNHLMDRVEMCPLVSYQNLQYEIAEVDVNIIPLVKDTFTNCKSELKFFESAILKVPTIATDTFIYDKVIDHGKNGLLARDNKDWYEQLNFIYSNPDISKKIALNAHDFCVEKYGNSQQKNELEKTFSSILKTFGS